ncbi:uncharacterized protein DNG_03195 [Cephalotrichum gorgonifer]|uniref:N-acetyltransferase domain-containing protein n=1 Tax=Cephalotrichum gorgonifer TaxID=2041049 RepID=A0AAE8STC4_9PEZI|nr:uncharacterized protein DNG_03195 [Cephalotrichum gorgonifer]
MANSSSDVRVEVIQHEDDIAHAFDAASNTFGRQTRDAIWMAMNPGWDTPEGRTKCVARMVTRWRDATRDRDGNLNTTFIKATVPDPQDPTQRAVAGVAIWMQTSAVEGRGVPPPENLIKDMGIEELYPDDEAEQRFLAQVMGSLCKQRWEAARKAASTQSPAIMGLDMCVVNPAFQRRGVAGKLVEWGLKEVERRGGMEAVTEASSMGRSVYARLGFQQEGPEIVYQVDEEFAGRDTPSNIFMRTGTIGRG